MEVSADARGVRPLHASQSLRPLPDHDLPWQPDQHKRVAPLCGRALCMRPVPPGLNTFDLPCLCLQINYPYVRRRRDFGKHAAFTGPPAQVTATSC